MSSAADGTDLAARFRGHLAASGCLEGVRHAVVAVSGGVDSMTLLHLLRFGGAAPSMALHAAHLDHGMRADSGADAEWLAGVCAGWGVTHHLRTASTPVRTEAEGSELRYRFFAEVAEGLGTGAAILTGHTADDQAETVLFRIARGSGPRGLAGILPGRSPSIVRPLLPFRRAEVEAHAAAHEVPCREDPTNRDTRWTRNRIRHEILPALEAAVPGAAAALAALAGTSRVESAALDQLLDERIAALASAEPADASPSALSFDRNALAALPDPLLTVLLRRAATQTGGFPGRTATAALLRFVREAPSGRRITLEGGVTVEHQLGAIHLRGAATGPGEGVTARDTGARASSLRASSPTGQLPRVRVEPPSGEAGFTHGACTVAVSWQSTDGGEPAQEPPPAVEHRSRAGSPGARPHSPFVAHFAPGDVGFPLDVRPWAPGDLMTLPYGKKKVKKILLEARIPAGRRAGWPVVADAAGAILWVPGSPQLSCAVLPSPGDVALRLEVRIR